MNTTIFDKIIGYESEKKEILRLADAWGHPEKYRALGIDLPLAILLHGKPGLGKTMFANALIEACGLPCFPCRKDRPDGAFVTAITETFSKAAGNAPSVVFLDDMDKFAEDNLQEDSNKEEFSTIQSCMEAVQGKGVFIIATANAIHNLPESLLRAGRFGRQICFSAPSPADAEQIIRHYLQNKKIESGISPKNLALIMQGKSCAALKSVIDEAGLLAGFEGKASIERAHLIRAILSVLMHAKIGNTDPHSGLFAAYHEAGHAVAGLALGKRIGFISIYSSEESGGICISEPDRIKCVFEDVLKEAVVAVSGKAAIEIRFGQADIGCRNDLDNVIDHIRPALTRCCAGGFSYGYDRDTWENRQSSARVGHISEKLYDLIEECYRKAKEILSANRDLLDRIATELLTSDALLEDDLATILSEVPIRK